MQPIENNETFKLVKKLYKNDEGKPFELTPSQVGIFDTIWKKQHPRVHIMTYTQYGKSDVVSLAVLTRVTNFNEKWAIVAPTVDKAKIIMGYIIKHIFDNDYCQKKFEIKPDENLERIRRERSKNRVTFRNTDGIGEIFILSAEATRKGEDVGNKLMGFGAPNIVQDEAALIPDQANWRILRMFGGHKVNFFAKIGNPLKRHPPFSHFYKSYLNSRYKKIIVDYKVGIADGRQNASQFEEYREELGEIEWGMMYECQFPDADLADDKDYYPLITEKLYKDSISEKFHHFGEGRLGCDVAAGGDYSVIVYRSKNGAEVIYRGRTKDTLQFSEKIAEKMKELRVKPENVFIDIVGVGRGVFDDLKRKNNKINGVNVGQTAFSRKEFTNIRAEAYWAMFKWLRKGGMLKPHRQWDELLGIRYTKQADKLIRIKSKREMKSEGIASPDVVDALVLTFVYPDDPYTPFSEKSPIQGIGTPARALKQQDRVIRGIGR